jgi:TPP-dependent pyruvate/acetoin dehydrogenase alpha subunit
MGLDMDEELRLFFLFLRESPRQRNKQGSCVRYNVPVMDNNLSLYKTMLLIRRFEEHLLFEFSTGKLVGTTHTYIGQEADAAGIFPVIEPEDVVFSNHRCHGHFLAYGGEPYRLAA